MDQEAKNRPTQVSQVVQEAKNLQTQLNQTSPPINMHPDFVAGADRRMVPSLIDAAAILDRRESFLAGRFGEFKPLIASHE